MSSNLLNYTCPKCANKSYELGQMRATGGTLSKIFDIKLKNSAVLHVKNVSTPSFIKRQQVH